MLFLCFNELFLLVSNGLLFLINKRLGVGLLLVEFIKDTFLLKVDGLGVVDEHDNSESSENGSHYLLN